VVNFLLLIKRISAYSKKDIDQGKTPKDIYKLCSCIRESFCLSYSIRKENNLYLVFQEKNFLIKFEGKKLKFLSSDERSQALLLLKALKLSSEIYEFNRWYKSTPGIYISKFQDFTSILNFMHLSEKKCVLILSNLNKANNLWEIIESNQIKDSNDCFYVIPFHEIINFLSNLINIFKEQGKKKYLIIIPIKSIENVILYINYKIDQIQRN